ncbi:MAG: WXG100 family type VII secretion target [Gracilibacteraceae bacterium]|jgi:WXG100 family type VII secretion target|nr:WXG100 family type VII secretion target [Gracilibacteraceae bacterium]
MADITLRVDPNVLNAKAGEMDGHKNSIIQIMEQAKQEITSLTGTWKSAAADEFQNRFKQIYDDIDNMLAVASEHITDIKEAAQIYITAENAAKTAAEGLPIDGVTR